MHMVYRVCVVSVYSARYTQCVYALSVSRVYRVCVVQYMHGVYVYVVCIVPSVSSRDTQCIHTVQISVKCFMPKSLELNNFCGSSCG